MQTENNVCSICLHEFTQPKLLTCLHSYCYQCLHDYVNKSKQDGDQFPCPLCRHQIHLPSGGVQDFPNSPHGQINNDGDVVKSSEAGDDVTSSCVDDVIKSTDDGATNERPKQICDVCDSEQVLKFLCKTCQQTLCDDCKTSHDKHDVKKKHDVVDICRIEEEEEGGDSRHVRGVELKDTSDEVCTVHPHELINFHCTKCTVSVCALCLFEHHNGHKMLYLNDKETQTKPRQDLQKLNDDLQLQIDRLETFSQQLASERSKLQNSTEQECNAVDEQVQLMCKMLKTRGDEIKTMLRNTNDMERQNLETMMAELESSINKLKSDIKKASDSLEGKSIIKILEIIQTNQKVETEFKHKDLVLPDLENPSFKVGKIIEDELFQQLGSYENNKEQILNYNINTILNHEDLIQGDYFTFSGLKWGVGVGRDTTSDYLGVYLGLCESDSNSIDERVEYSFTLINKTPSKPITWGPTTHQFTPGGQGKGYPITPWSTLIDPSNGFTDKDGHFSVRIRIKTLKPLPV